MGVQLQPIRDIDTVRDITQTLSRQRGFRGERMFLMWVVGINMGMRISDMLELRVGDLRRARAYTYLPKKQAHKKGAHKITIPVPVAVRKVVQARCQELPDSAYLLRSRKRTAGGQPKPITRQTARADMKEIARICGVKESMGCHTMRKTFGYHYYKKHKNIAILQEWFYHESPATTLIYIGVALENFEKMVNDSPFDLEDVEI